MIDKERQEARPADPRLLPGNCHKCGCPRVDNPHPDAGKPGRYLEVGCTKECLPCTVLSRHQWYQRTVKAEKELRELKEVSPLTEDQRTALEAAIRVLGNGNYNSRYAEMLRPLLRFAEPETGDLLEEKIQYGKRQLHEAIDRDWRNHNRLANVPHHLEDGMRIIGFVVPVSEKWPMACIQEQLAEIIEPKDKE